MKIIFFLMVLLSTFLYSKNIPKTTGKAGHVAGGIQLNTYLMTYATKNESWYNISENFNLLNYGTTKIDPQFTFTFFLTDHFMYSFYIDAIRFDIHNKDGKINNIFDMFKSTKFTLGFLTSAFIKENISLDLGIATRYDSYDFLFQFGLSYYILRLNQNDFAISNYFNILIKRKFVLENIFSIKWSYVF